MEYIETWGDETAPTVVLLHPAGGTRHNWDPHAETLAAEYHVTAVDLPAHGDHPATDFDYARAVADIGSVLDAVGSAVIVGHSMGGYIAMRVAAEHSEYVDGLLVAGASPNFRSGKMLLLSAAYYPVSYVLGAIARSERLSERVTRLLGEEVDTDQEEDEVDIEPRRRLYGTAQFVRAAAFQRTWPYAEAYDGPIGVAHGEQEPFDTHAEQLARRAGGDLVWYEGGHQAPMSNPDEFADIVTQFLSDVYAYKAI